MGKLVYSAIQSLDGYVEDEHGKFGWAEPAKDVHDFVNGIQRGIQLHLYGRRLYETMAAWETIDDPRDEMREFATSWRTAEKVVYSRTLREVSSARTRIERDFDVGAVRALVDSAGTDAVVGGATLAAEAIRGGIVDEFHFYVVPVVVGGGVRSLPDGVLLKLALLEERRFGDGTVFLRYRRS